MAYVATTEKTIEQIRRNIEAMQNAEIATTGGLVPKFNEIMEIKELREEIEASAWGEFIDLRNRLTDRMSWRGNVTIYVYYNNPNSNVLSGTKHTAVTIKVEKFPFGMLPNDTYYKLTSYDYAFPCGHEHPHIQDIQQLLMEIDEIKTRWEKVSKQMLTFIRSAKSINEAVKLWPDVKAYLPKDIIDRLEEKSTRKESTVSSAAAVLEKMDIETIKQSAVIGKMLSKP